MGTSNARILFGWHKNILYICCNYRSESYS